MKRKNLGISNFITLIDPFKNGLFNILKTTEVYNQNPVISIKSEFGIKEHYNKFILNYLNEIKNIKYTIIDMSPFTTIRRVANLDYLRSYYREFKSILPIIIVRADIADEIEYLGEIDGPILVISQNDFDIRGDKDNKEYNDFFNWLKENKLNTSESIHSIFVKENLIKELNINFSKLIKDDLIIGLKEYFYKSENIFNIAYEIAYQITEGFQKLEDDIGTILVIDNLSLIIASIIKYILKKDIKFLDFDRFLKIKNNQNKLKISYPEGSLILIKLLIFDNDLENINLILKTRDLKIFSIIEKIANKDIKLKIFSFLDMKDYLSI